MNINALIRQQCNESCSIINSSTPFTPSLILIICKDKIVHRQSRFVWLFKEKIANFRLLFSGEQHRVSSADILLLLMNNISRRVRTQFESREYGAYRAMAHVYKTRSDLNNDLSARHSTGRVSTDKDPPPARRVRHLGYQSLFHSPDFQ